MPTLPATLPLQVRSGAISKPTLGNGRHELIWSSGAAVRRIDFDGQVFDEILDLDGADLTRLNNGAPVLDSHRSWNVGNVIGVVESASVRSGRGYATIRLSERPEAAGIKADIAAGILRNVSVGYSIDEVKTEARKGKPPIMRVIRWTPLELSIVSVPADPAARIVRSTDSRLFPVRLVTGTPTARRRSVAEIQAAIMAQVSGRV